MSQLFESSVRHHLAPIAHLLDDDSVSEVLINGPEEIFFERAGKLALADGVRFEDEYALNAACVNIAQFVGKVFDDLHQEVGDLGALLVGPMTRGAEVSLR